MKQDFDLQTEIKDEKKIIIDGQYIGELQGIKLKLDLKADAMDTDIKSLKKAARKGIGPELIDRVEKIINDNSLNLNDDFKIYWQNNPIAHLNPGKN